MRLVSKKNKNLKKIINMISNNNLDNNINNSEFYNDIMNNNLDDYIDDNLDDNIDDNLDDNIDDNLDDNLDDNSYSDEDYETSDDDLSSIDSDIISKEYVGKIINKYLILKYLTRGTFSTIWLVLNIESKTYNILKLQNDNCTDEGKNEIKLFKHINSTYICKLLDYFSYNSQICLVFELLGDNLSIIYNFFDCIPDNLLIKIYNQILNGINELHQQNIIHTDLKLDNILIKNPSYETYKFIKFMNTNLVESCKNELNLEKINLIINSYKSDFDEEEKNIYYKNIFNDLHIKIIDLGNSEIENNISNYEIGYKLYRSPENILGYEYDTKSDIWTLGCIFYELLTQSNFLELETSNSLTTDTKLLIAMSKQIGNIDKDYLINSEFGENIYHEEIFYGKNNLIDNLSEYTNNELIKNLIFKMLNYYPKLRIDAIECIKIINFS